MHGKGSKSTSISFVRSSSRLKQVFSFHIGLHTRSLCSSLQGKTEGFPEECSDVAVSHLECSVAKREYAYETAVQLAGKDAVDKVLPKYEESMSKATELINLYKENSSGGKTKKDVFWG